MTLEEMIYRHAQKLPDSFQREVLDFVQYLLMKAEQQEEQDWSKLSLSSAMQGMEDEPGLYTVADIKVRFA
ncbi:MAG: DUF2281 domain-containing protein [Anaerolineae bacterium]|nr:MAG: DUF2281 domain-containing protein [Anaerolineae bacterium]